MNEWMSVWMKEYILDGKEEAEDDKLYIVQSILVFSKMKIM